MLEAIEFVGLEVSPETGVGGSGPGERRLVEIARAVVGNPRVVLLDEPAAGLPDEETEHLGKIIRGIPDRFGALVILVDHDMSLVSACCGTTAVLDFGKLIASGPTAEVLRDEHVIAPTWAPRRSCERRVRRRRRPGCGWRRSRSAGRAPVVPDVSLEIPPGEVTTLLGPNGAGKSTLVLAVGGRAAPSGGRVLLGDQDLTRLGPSGCAAPASRSSPRDGGCCPSSPSRTTCASRPTRSPRRRRERHRLCARALPRAREALDGLGRLLSGGEQQMVVLAQALVSQPSILLVDELSLGLAPVVVKRLVPTLEAVAARASASC